MSLIENSLANQSLKATTPPTDLRKVPSSSSKNSSFSLKNIFPIDVLRCFSSYLDETTRSFMEREGELPFHATILKIIDTPNKILWQLPQGIPDSSAPLIDGHEHFRHFNPRSQGRSCWIDVFQHMLSGAYPVRNLTMKKTEEALDVFRARLTDNETEIRIAKKLLHDSSVNLDDPSSAKKQAKKAISSKSLTEEQNKVLEEFIKKSETGSFQKYIQIKTEIDGVAAYSRFFKQLNVRPLDVIPQAMLDYCCEASSSQHIKNEDIEKLPLSIQYRIANIVGKRALAQIYGSASSSWNPSKTIDLLLKEVREHGMIGFGGLFGKNLYTEMPHPVMEISGRKIFGWSAGTRDSGYSVGHFIGVVGVIKETNLDKIKQGKTGYVIYVDPVDGSNPQDPLQQKFYLISYETFSKYVNNEFGMRIDLESLSMPYEKYEALILKDCPKLPSLTYGRLPNPPYLVKKTSA